MTREEQIIKIGAQFAIDETDGQTSGRAASMRGILLSAFRAGAHWADSHPNWFSVADYEKDELPPLTDKEDQYGCSVSVLFVVNLDGINYINKGCFDYDTGVWHSIDTGLSYTKEQVTHWMPLPQPPRKEE